MLENEELKKTVEQSKKMEKCPTCGALRERLYQMARHTDYIIDFLMQNRITKRESCIKCVEKHTGYALSLYREMLSLKGNAKGMPELNFLEIIGELRAATEESFDFPDLYSLLMQTERNFRYEGTEPDWQKIAELIETYK